MSKQPIKPENKGLQQKLLAHSEYERLKVLYAKYGADAVQLEINDNLIRKVAELFATLEMIKDLPSVVFDKNNPSISKETGAGKARVKYMAQYTVSMRSLAKDLLGGDPDDDNALDAYK